MKHLLSFTIFMSTALLSCSPRISKNAEPPPGVTGMLEHHQNFSSELVNPRQIDVWLPTSYMKNGAKRYPVIYMHDGQNLFDPKTSFIGVDWGIDETLTQLIQENKVPEAIVVGIWNTPKRVQEYMPQKPFERTLSPEEMNEFIQKYGRPLSDKYLEFMVKELKPFIDANYRTRPDRDHTFVMGSSMGGLISAYALCEYPDVFGGAACLSPHWPAVADMMMQYLKESLPDPMTHKIYFDYGTEALDAQYEAHQMRANQVIKEAGYVEGKNWITKKFPGDEHSERAWRRRVDIPLIFFLLQTGPAWRAQKKLVPFEEKGKWGYMDEHGKVCIKPQFIMVEDFSLESLAAVVDGSGWAYIDIKGDVVIRPFVVDNGPDYFHEGLARFVMDNKFGFFDKTGKTVIEPQFDFARPFSEGLAAICVGGESKSEGEYHYWEGSRWGYVNKKGGLVVPTKFEDARAFDNGRARVKIEGEWKYIDKQGEIVPQRVQKVGRPSPDEDVSRTTLSAPMLWLHEPAARWLRDFSGSRRDSLIPVPKADLEKEGIGIKARVYDLFDRWSLNEEIRGHRGTHYAEVTGKCKGMIELEFALAQEEWRKPQNRIKYYRAVDKLINKIGNTLLADFGNKLESPEKELFLRALKTLAWQESKWQHCVRYKDWFFVIVSGGSYNKLDDWGITQIARSSFHPDKLLNENFFESKGHCSISSSLYYGFMEYYFCYMEARENPANGPSLINKIIGAYNRYSSGYSSSCFELAKDDEAYRNYQIRAMGGFKDNFVLKPWESLMNLEDEAMSQK